jgi:hypothetical protein
MLRGVTHPYSEKECPMILDSGRRSILPVWAAIGMSLAGSAGAEGSAVSVRDAFDKTEGIAQGRRVANYVFRNAFEAMRRPHGR